MLSLVTLHLVPYLDNQEKMMVHNNRTRLTLIQVWALLILSIISCTAPANPIKEKLELDEISASHDVSTKTSATAHNTGNYSISLYNNNRRFDTDSLEISSLKGGPIILNFWAAMCPPCRAEMPELQSFYDLHKGKVTIIGIDIGEQTGLGTTEEAIQLMETLNIEYPNGSFNDSEALKSFNVLTMPTTIFMDSDGAIFRRWAGAINYETLSVITNLMLSYQDT